MKELTEVRSLMEVPSGCIVTPVPGCCTNLAAVRPARVASPGYTLLGFCEEHVSYTRIV
jgi:hypothetical protein